MALDLTLAAEHGESEIYIAVGLEAHFKLMQLAEAKGLNLLRRMADYYADANFTVAELDELAAELDRLEVSHSDVELRTLVDAMDGLIERAKSLGCGLSAVSD